MPSYHLTAQAEEDLKGIARYTLEQWGRKQSIHYASLLGDHFRSIASENILSHTFSVNFPQIKVSHCEHHYIFHIHPDKKQPVIIAVLHERMDMLARLKNRLD